MKKPHLITISFVVDADGDVPDAGLSEVDRLGRCLIDAMTAAVPSEDPLGWQSLRVTELDPETVNCGQCGVCSGWVTDRERPEPVSGLCNGARVNGQLLCDEHLPANHRWAF